MFAHEREIQKRLAEISLEEQSNKIPIFTAINSNNLQEVKRLIGEGADINVHAPGGGKTPLHSAVELGYVEIAVFLVESKANVNSVTQRKFTPLHVAAQKGNCKLIELFVKTGADINAYSDVGCTALHEAAANGQKEAVIKLLELKADPNIKESRYNLTAANLANEKQHISTMDILCKSMTYQQCFIQNINYILFNYKRKFIAQSIAYQFTDSYQFIDKLSKAIVSTENGDEIFTKVSIALKSPEYLTVAKELGEMRQLLIANMNQYNADKLAAIQPHSRESLSAENLPLTTASTSYTKGL